jgi:hypothetical protein
MVITVLDGAMTDAAKQRTILWDRPARPRVCFLFFLFFAREATLTPLFSSLSCV